MEVSRLELAAISKRFLSREVVKDLSLRLMPGQVSCLLGPSGCGKSTTLAIAAGVERQSTGAVLLDGQVISDDQRHLPAEARKIGLMFQEFALFPHLNVANNVAFGLKHRTKARRLEVSALLERVALTGFEKKFPHELSGGEQQRVALARALAPKPRVMLMDEPFSGLDDRLRDTVRDDTLELLRKEATSVLLVTHDPEEAMRAADEVILMRAGSVVQRGAPYNIYSAPRDLETAAFFSDLNVFDAIVKDTLAQTPFGPFLVPGMKTGVSIKIAIRPQHLRIDFDRSGRGPNPTDQDGVAARGSVLRARFLGSRSLVEFKMDYQGIKLVAEIPGVFLPEPGSVFWLTAPRNRCFIFEKNK